MKITKSLKAKALEIRRQEKIEDGDNYVRFEIILLGQVQQSPPEKLPPCQYCSCRAE